MQYHCQLLAASHEEKEEVMFEQGDLVVLKENSLSYRAGAKLVVLEVKGDQVRVGITFADGGEFVPSKHLEKTCK